MNCLVLTVILLETFAVLAQSEARSEICYVVQAVSQVATRTLYQPAYYKYSTTYACGFLWTRRCRHTHYTSHQQSFISYQTVTIYTAMQKCCPGYEGTPPDCQAIKVESSSTTTTGVIKPTMLPKESSVPDSEDDHDFSNTAFILSIVSVIVTVIALVIVLPVVVFCTVKCFQRRQQHGLHNNNNNNDDDDNVEFAAINPDVQQYDGNDFNKRSPMNSLNIYH